MPPEAAAIVGSRDIVIEVLRYRSDMDLRPVPQTYRVPFTYDMSVLQGLQYIKDHLDGTLSFRWSCRMAICGSCGMMIGGEPKLACMTFMRDYHPGPLKIEPLKHFPVERDLVVTVAGFVKKIESIYPYLIPKTPRRAGRRRISADPDAARAVRVVQRLYQLHAVLCRLPAVWRKS
jgi:fumarate reductase iron-sulfur subunit